MLAPNITQPFRPPGPPRRQYPYLPGMSKTFFEASSNSSSVFGGSVTPACSKQLLVVEHRPQVETVGDHVGGVLDGAADLEGSVVKTSGILPALR